MIAVTAMELVLVVQVSALYGNTKTIIRLLAGLFICQTAIVIATTTAKAHYNASSLGDPNLPDCFNFIPLNTYSDWIPLLAFEGIIMILTIYKIIVSYRNDLTPTVMLLTRDSIGFFVLVFSSLLANVLLCRYTYQFRSMMMVPVQSVACIAATRMMINIGGLCNCVDAETLSLSFPQRTSSITQYSVT
jgi:hypothetical protein